MDERDLEFPRMVAWQRRVRRAGSVHTMYPGAFPRMQAYLDSLPRGLDSHATHVQKAGILRELLGDMLKPRAADLPPPLREMVERPPPVGSWVPEVHACALYLAARDLMPSDDAYMRHMYAANRALVDGVIYGFLFRLLTPRRILDGARSRWTQLHKGITFEVLHGEDPNATGVVLRFPSNLVPELLLRSYCEAFRAALDVAGGRDVRVELLECTPVLARFMATWR